MMTTEGRLSEWDEVSWMREHGWDKQMRKQGLGRINTGGRLSEWDERN